ncbi:MAG: hypothetical protein L6V81_00270 [Clostridium sp.]|nr:MAG: hypothetical protein L6V81_00270 [Clostridium sp.]
MKMITLLKIINETGKRDQYSWDNRYNEGKDATWGYNNFELSRAKEILKNTESNEEIVNESIKNAIISKELCVGKRKLDDETKNGSVECSVKSTDKYMFGLITPYEYMRASLDDNCKVASSPSCSNYNYLYHDRWNTWSLTALDTKR